MFQQGVTLKELLENPELLNPPKLTDNPVQQKDKQKDLSNASPYGGQSAFLGPNIWDKTLPYTEDFNLEYMDLDEFLMENGITGDPNLESTAAPSSTTSPLIPSSPVGQMSPIQMSPSPPQLSPAIPKPQPKSSQLQKYLTQPVSPLSSAPAKQGTSTPGTPESGDDYSVDEMSLSSLPAYGLGAASYPSVDEGPPESPGEVTPTPGLRNFDPRAREFTEDELRPQPMIKKSRKVYVPDELKDEKYWTRRKKNNRAAKRSRDARRVKENQIAMRASFLEKESKDLRVELCKLKEENKKLRERLRKYESD